MTALALDGETRFSTTTFAGKKDKRVKIAMLGGGPSALSALYAITSSPGWNEKFDITLYQMGWRLGGKCASRRIASERARNEEHGLHVLGGFYHNTMDMLRQCYGEWAHVGALPFSFDTAFIPHNLVHLVDHNDNGTWEAFQAPLVRNDLQIGVGFTNLTPKDMIDTILYWIKKHYDKFVAEMELDAEHPLLQLHEVADMLGAFDLTHEANETVVLLASRIEGVLEFLRESEPPQMIMGQPNYRLLLQIALICLRGMIKDKVALTGFDALNDWELLDWLRHHGMPEHAMKSAFVRSGFDYLFAYAGGDTNCPTLAAGVGIRGLLRMIFTYHDTLFVHMYGGMAEVVFTPIYEVLKARGVKFKFFHRVDRIRLDADGHFVDEIDVTVQAKLKNPAEGYDPLTTLIGRRVWPEYPKYELLDTEEKIYVHPDDVWESPWAEIKGSEKATLVRGTDFDVAILGISVAALREICAPIAERLPRWAEMLAAQEAVATIGAQYWMHDTTHQLGWTGGPTVLTSYGEPLATWADMSFLLPLEENAAGAGIHQLSYFCGPMTLDRADQRSPDYRNRERARAEAITDHWLGKYIGTMWPEAVVPTSGSFRPGMDVNRMVQSNNFPSDLYVLSRPGTIDARMRTNETDLVNLYIVGDWIRTGADSGCVETAVMSGFQCARAICGHPQIIPGETDFPVKTGSVP